MKKSSGYLNRDGSLNAVRKGVRPHLFSDLYHYLLSMSWPAFFALVVFVYLVLNTLFASLYFSCGPSGLDGLDGSRLSFFWECFFFSVQTIATIGYGHVHPVGALSNSIVAVEALVGILGIAIITGLLFSRFSRPTARILFSNVALMTKEGKRDCLVFRIANERKSQITEGRLHVVMLKEGMTEDGEEYRKIHDLKLERNFSPVFALTWTAIHWIDEQSPLYGMDREKWKEESAEILVSLMGTDEIFAQPIYARHAYRLEDIVWNGRFEDIIVLKDSHIEMHLDRIHSVKA